MSRGSKPLSTEGLRDLQLLQQEPESCCPGKPHAEWYRLSRSAGPGSNCTEQSSSANAAGALPETRARESGTQQHSHRRWREYHRYCCPVGGVGIRATTPGKCERDELFHVAARCGESDRSPH